MAVGSELEHDMAVKVGASPRMVSQLNPQGERLALAPSLRNHLDNRKTGEDSVVSALET